MPSSMLPRLGGLPTDSGRDLRGDRRRHPSPRADGSDRRSGSPGAILRRLAVLLGWPAVLARQSGRIGILGPLGFVLVFIGLAFNDITHSVLEFSLVPVLASDPATRPLLSLDSATTAALMHRPFGLMMVLGLPLTVLGLVAFGWPRCAGGHCQRGQRRCTWSRRSR
jgi:hypothetical protein